jgi:N-acetylmuramoyl-L-alanine amidase
MKCKRNAKRVVALALALLAVAPFMAISPKAINVYGVKEVYDARASKYEYVKVRVGSGNIEVPSRLIHSTTYVSLKYFCEALCYCKTTYSSATRTATVTADNLKITAQDGSHYICANGRYLWTDTAVKILDDGRIYVPIRTLAKAFGVSVDWDNATRSVTVKGPLNIIKSGDAYYNADAVYWLSRIISAESRGEPLLGQIAVGNVVLNRVRSPNYPNTIYGVIFDRKYGVQFTPVANGTIYNTPYYLSVIAAKICLEGETVSPDVLYFLEPEISTSFWIVKNCHYEFGIGCHDFYS